jgi:stringent starvation protein B
MSAILPPKKDVALALLERASVFVHLDPRAEGVVVPPWLRKQPQLVLQIGLNMAVKIPDLEIVEGGVSCTLSFSRRPHFCYVPWTAVYALVGEDGRGMVWPEDIPPEVASQSPAAATSRRRPTLRPIAGPDAGSERESVRPEAGGTPVPRRPTEAPRAVTERPPRAEPRPVPAPIPASAKTDTNDTPAHRQSVPVPAELSNPGARSPSERPYLRLVK